MIYRGFDARVVISERFTFLGAAIVRIRSNVPSPLHLGVAWFSLPMISRGRMSDVTLSTRFILRTSVDMV
jgi:hypothetical protein